MTPEEQRIAIAEWCGWQFKYSEYMHRGCVEVIRPDASHCTDWPIVMHDNGWLGYLPDYLNDLNAMHEAEKLLKPKQWKLYSDKLMRSLCDSDLTLNGSNIEARYKSAHATAAQRSEALLKTIGKWKD